MRKSLHAFKAPSAPDEKYARRSADATGTAMHRNVGSSVNPVSPPSSRIRRREYATTSMVQPIPRIPSYNAPAVIVNPARYVLLPLAAAVTGYTIKAMQRKIERGDWQEGKVWKRAPDGRVLIDLLGYQRWVEKC
jgi:hypothetical protein